MLWLQRDIEEEPGTAPCAELPRMPSRDLRRLLRLLLRRRLRRPHHVRLGGTEVRGFSIQAKGAKA